MKKKSYIYFWMNMLWTSGPTACIVNVLQYALEGISGTVVLFFTGKIIDEISLFDGNDKVQIQERIYLYIFFIAVSVCVSTLWYKFSQYLREKHIFYVQQKFDKEICNKMIQIPHDILDTKKFQDDFRIVNETNSKIYLFVTYAAQCVSLFVQLFVPLILVSKMSVALLTFNIIFIVVCVRITSKIQLSYWSEYLSKTSLRRKMDYFLNNIFEKKSLAIVKAFNSEKYFLKKANHIAKECVDEANGIIIRQNNSYAKTQLFVLVLPFIIICCALFNFYKGAIQVGDVVMYVGLAKSIHVAIISLGTCISQLQETCVSLKKMYEFIFSSQMVNNDDNVDENIDIKEIKDIKVDNLYFYYPDEKEPAIRGISLHIHAGEKIAIVGENGSGKTTFIKILLGLYRNYQGTITVNGIDLRKISQGKLSRLMAPCFQDFLQAKFLVREAIGYSNLDNIYCDEKLVKHMANTNCEELLEKINLDTQLGVEFSEGVELSLGQWQKLATARAFFGQKNITVLDEPVSANDIYSEALFLKTINENIEKNQICIFISHRMSGMKGFDKIFVFSRGKIIESGNHDSLIKAGGKYSDLFESQNMVFDMLY